MLCLANTSFSGLACLRNCSGTISLQFSAISVNVFRLGFLRAIFAVIRAVSAPRAAGANVAERSLRLLYLLLCLLV